MNKIVLKLLYISLLALTPIWSLAEEKQAPLDFVNQQLSTQMLNQVKAMSTPELVAAQANYYRKLYEALIKSGFTKNEALQIVVAKAEVN